ncbi:hypothetical protein DN752_04410 [Echinicola strongylocentroti]|uniref:Uncharacterized protein n=1 Tax=Echinicola strongylocentroti TaxID=1795355 RepID=A0A2Z4IFS1_9BACT|nr:hypothetical protein [Echinicola strongylocentroti]AWW29446.1 hypothetical protein DN752_04410 [Echinicola strongylocentroti]
MEKSRTVQPGELLKLEFMDPFELCIAELSTKSGIAEQQLSTIIRGEGKITLGLAKNWDYFGTTIAIHTEQGYLTFQWPNEVQTKGAFFCRQTSKTLLMDKKLYSALLTLEDMLPN